MVYNNCYKLKCLKLLFRLPWCYRFVVYRVWDIPKLRAALRSRGKRNGLVLEMHRDVPSGTILCPLFKSWFLSPSLTLVSIPETKLELKLTLHWSNQVRLHIDTRKTHHHTSMWHSPFILKSLALSSLYPQGRYVKCWGRLYILHNKYTEFTFRSNIMPYFSPRLNNLNTYMLLRKAKHPATHQWMPRYKSSYART